MHFAAGPSSLVVLEIVGISFRSLAMDDVADLGRHLDPRTAWPHRRVLAKLIERNEKLRLTRQEPSTTGRPCPGV